MSEVTDASRVVFGIISSYCSAMYVHVERLPGLLACQATAAVRGRATERKARLWNTHKVYRTIHIQFLN